MCTRCVDVSVESGAVVDLFDVEWDVRNVFVDVGRASGLLRHGLVASSSSMLCLGGRRLQW